MGPLAFRSPDTGATSGLAPLLEPGAIAQEALDWERAAPAGVSRFGTAVNPSMGAAVENILFSRLPKRDNPAATAEVVRSVALGERASGKESWHTVSGVVPGGATHFQDERRNRTFRVSKPTWTYLRAVLKMSGPARNDAWHEPLHLELQLRFPDTKRKKGRPKSSGPPETHQYRSKRPMPRLRI